MQVSLHGTLYTFVKAEDPSQDRGPAHLPFGLEGGSGSGKADRYRPGKKRRAHHAVAILLCLSARAQSVWKRYRSLHEQQEGARLASPQSQSQLA